MIPLSLRSMIDGFHVEEPVDGTPGSGSLFSVEGAASWHICVESAMAERWSSF